MARFKIGVIVDSFRVGIDEGIKKAKEIGAEGIQVYTAGGDMGPDSLTDARIREIRDMVESNGLVISAVVGDLGGFGFTRADENPAKIEMSRRIMENGKKLGTNIVTTHIGCIPADPNHDRRKIMQEACNQLGTIADSLGMHFAIETGPEKCVTLKSFLDSLDCKGMGVNFDPANLVMVADDDPAEGAKTLGKYIVHTHAKDGNLLHYVTPEAVYGYLDEDQIRDVNVEKPFEEVPLGEGGVDFDRYLDALESIGYNGFLTIEREVGENPFADIKKAVEFLRAKI
jgi:L-ribulose-5-phosphate 3-epimerase